MTFEPIIQRAFEQLDVNEEATIPDATEVTLRDEDIIYVTLRPPPLPLVRAPRGRA
jgi:hypothetical protein